MNIDGLLLAYRIGMFPMADSRHSSTIRFHLPAERAIFPLFDVNIPRSVRQLFHKNKYHFTVDTAFDQVIQNCADRGGYDGTWINDEIIETYIEMNKRGNAHSVEVWNESNQLVGGLYGVHIGGAFFGESMFGKESNVTKLALFFLHYVLLKNHFLLLDSQYGNEFTYSMGAVEIDDASFHTLLSTALNLKCEFKV